MIVEGYEFLSVETIFPILSSEGSVAEFMPQERYKNTKRLPLNPYGQGPFCRFKLKFKNPQGGIYLLEHEGEVHYVGICQNLEKRFGLSQYGSISPKNCFRGGQSTNCHINSIILQYAKGRKHLTILFLPIADNYQRKKIESLLIQKNAKVWNIQRPL
jgi:hypothetical protein